MPKKNRKPVFAKPTNSAHHSLASSQSSNGNPASGASSSVNDLITRLRRSGGSSAASDEVRASSVTVTPRTVHPSIRNLLEIPETPPPRPRPNTRRIGGARVRRPPGPAAPTSWFTSNLDTPRTQRTGARYIVDSSRIRRLERLPGIQFPARDTLQHAVLKSMAVHWQWHVEYDGEFLSELPTRLKVLLLSYISTYSDGDLTDTGIQGFRYLFVGKREPENAGSRDPDSDRLDLGNAIGHWISLKQLRTGLTSVDSTEASTGAGEGTTLPTSWDDEAESSSLPLATTPSPTLRFHDLRYLSLAHPNPSTANWASLLNLLSNISTLTHLSLAHWPVPTLTPNSINARINHPNHKSLSFAYGGTDTYSAYENNWAEASGVLKRLSWATYCLKWIDLEGCGAWYGALSWPGENDDNDNDNAVEEASNQRVSPGPDWNGTWRGVEWVGLGPGWIPRALQCSRNGKSGDSGGEYERQPTTPRPSFSSLASSIHAPPDIRNLAITSDEPAYDWDVEVERENYRSSKELEAYNEVLGRAKDVENWVQGLRREKGGKWIKFSIDERPGESA